VSEGGAAVSDDATSTLGSYETLTVEWASSGVARVMLNRPERLNALSFQMFEELGALAERAAAAGELRAIVLTGAGRGFCAGLDLDDAKALKAMSAAQMLAGQERWVGALAAYRYLPVPVIAAINGPAAGAGLALALMADIRLAAADATFTTAFVRIGLTGGDAGMSWLLPRLVGFSRASELLLTAERFDAAKAERIGLISRAVDPAELLGEAEELAATVASFHPLGVRLTKQVLQQNVDAPSLEAAMETENRNQVLISRTADQVEALDAFREKRAPVWSES
jgi:enoyl-CoA hydratase/carnithine racemase